MVEVNKEYIVMIERQDHFGSGICLIDGFLVFVAGTIVGEKVKIRITKCKKKYGIGEVIEFLSVSSNRKQAECPVFESCGGCQLMHQVYSYQLQFKENKVKDLLTRFTHLNPIIKPIIFDEPFYYRNKVIFHENNQKIGFYKEKTNEIIPVMDCLLIDRRLQEIYKSLISNSFLCGEIMLRKSSLNEVMVCLEKVSDINLFLKWANKNRITSLYVNNEHVFGKEYITEKIFGMEFLILPKAFFQVNYLVMLKMYQFIVDYYKNNKCSTVLDLYCGTGTIGMLVSPYVKDVVGVEVVEDAIKSALRNKEKNNVSNISFVLGKVEDHIDEFKDIDSIIVDPPRSGLDHHTVETILKIKPKSIVYVSCDPVTLARDLENLSILYDVTVVQPFDMFPNTYHVECVCVLKHKQTLEI